jgi:hypothetical protein
MYFQKALDIHASMIYSKKQRQGMMMKNLIEETQAQSLSKNKKDRLKNFVENLPNYINGNIKSFKVLLQLAQQSKKEGEIKLSRMSMNACKEMLHIAPRKLFNYIKRYRNDEGSISMCLKLLDKFYTGSESFNNGEKGKTDYDSMIIFLYENLQIHLSDGVSESDAVNALKDMNYKLFRSMLTPNGSTLITETKKISGLKGDEASKDFAKKFLGCYHQKKNSYSICI